MTIEWAGTFRHYHSAMFRTIPIGKANPKHFKMHEACVEALKKSEDKLKPGNKIGEVFIYMQKLLMILVLIKLE